METMSTLKRAFFVSLFAVLSLVLVACGGGGDDKKDTGDKEAKEGGDLVLAVSADAESLDPAGSNDVPSSVVRSQMYETLLTRDDDNNLQPQLAKSWEAIDDTTWEFELQEGVTFHDGEPFTAEAVKATLDRILDEKVAAPVFSYFEMIEEVEVVDDHTVRIKTEYPFAPILAHLSHDGSAIISPKLIEEDYKLMEEGKPAGSAFAKAAAGTGPFKFVSWTPGDEVKIERNDDYWGDKVHVDTVTYKVSPESTTRNADLEGGYVHVTDPVLSNEVSAINASGNAEVLEKTSSSISYIGFNTEKEPFDDPKVRRAVALAVDLDEIIDGIYDGFGTPAAGPLSPDTFGFDEDLKPMKANLDEAKKLLKEAGLEDGFKTTIWTNDEQQRVDTAIYLQNQLKQLNIDVAIEQMEWGAFLDKTAQGEHDMYILGWSNPVGDADYGLYALFHSKNKGDPGNRSFYENPEVDRLLDEGRQETDPEKRLAIYKEVQQIIAEDQPMVFIHHKDYLLGVSNAIEGFDINMAGKYQLRDVKFVE